MLLEVNAWGVVIALVVVYIIGSVIHSMFFRDAEAEGFKQFLLKLVLGTLMLLLIGLVLWMFKAGNHSNYDDTMYRR